MPRLEPRHPKDLLSALTPGLVALPDRLPVAAYWITLTAAVTLVAGVFQPLAVLGVGLALTAATWRATSLPTPHGRAWAWGSAVALLVTGAWLVVNLPLASEFVVVTRDPGFLTLQGFWLMDHASPDIPIAEAARVAAQTDGLLAGAGAYNVAGDVIHVQGSATLPGLLAIGGAIFGDAGVLSTNLVIGVLALLAVYGLARRVAGPVFGLLPVIAMAASMPWAFLTRTAYTEPLCIVMVFGGLTLVWSALTARHRSIAVSCVGGAMIGAAALPRIDGGLPVVGLIAGLALAAGAALVPVTRRRLLAAGAAAIVAACGNVVLGNILLRVRSPEYLKDLGSQSTLLLVALAAACGAALVVLSPRPWGRLRLALFRHRRVVAWTGLVLVLGLGAVLASRPLWLVEHLIPEGPVWGVIEAYQQAEGQPLDGSRSYDEMSVSWLSWYYGWPAVTLGFVGFALATYQAIARRDPRYLVLLGVIAAPTALYLYRVSITPDQIWALRRLLAVTVPGMLVAASGTLAALWSVGRAWSPAGRRLAVGAVALGSVVTAAFPVMTWNGLFHVVESQGRLAEAHTICDALDGRPVVLKAPVVPYLPTIRTICDVEVVQTGDVSEEQLADTAAAWDTEVVLVAFEPSGVTWHGNPAPYVATEWTRWRGALTKRPDSTEGDVSTVWMGVIQPDGTVAPLG